MKQAVFGLMAGFIIILSLVAILTVEGRSSRENELNQALSAAVEETMTNLCTTKKYTIGSQEEFVADFCQALLERVHAGSGDATDDHLTIQVDVMGIDVEKGLLSVAVKETFTHPNGRIGTVTCDATAILEQEEEKQEVVISYYVGGRLYKQYGLLEGEACKRPMDPEEPGKTFAYWRDSDTGEPAKFPGEVTENKTYVAVFRED